MDSPSSDCSEANENAAGLPDLAASQQYEDSIGRSPDEEDFMLCNLLPAGHACRKDELDGDGENKPPSENHAGDREPSPAQRPSNSQGRACRFANPLTDSEIVQKIDDTVPMSTRKTTQWSIKLWEDWRQHRLTTATCSSDIPLILEGITNKKLSYRLSKFVTECRKQQVLRWKRIVLMIVPLLLILVTAL